MITKTTSDLEILRHSPHLYCWGRIIKIHDIGEFYTIIEAEQTSKNLHPGEINYHPYVNGKNCHTYTSSFDDALIQCIAYKNFECNTANWFAQAALKLLSKEER